MKIKAFHLAIGFIFIGLSTIFSLSGISSMPRQWESKALSLLASINPGTRSQSDIVTVETDKYFFQKYNNFPGDKKLIQLIDLLLRQGVYSIGITTMPSRERPLLFHGGLENRVFYSILFRKIGILEKKKGIFLAKEVRRPSPAQSFKITENIGHINYKAEGPLISFPPIVSYKKNDYFALPVVLAADYLHIRPSNIKIPVDSKSGAAFVNIQKRRFDNYLYKEIEQSDSLNLKGKICLIGLSGVVQAQANSLSSILAGDIIRFCPEGVAVSISLILGLTLNTLLLRVRLVRFILFDLGLLVFYILVVSLLFISMHIYFYTLGPVMICLGFLLISGIDCLLKTKKLHGILKPNCKVKIMSQTLPQIKGFGIGFMYCLSGADAQKGLCEFAVLSDNCTGLLIGDVPKNGREADMYKKKLRTVFKNQASPDLEANQTLAIINDFLIKENKKLFASVVYLILESETKSVRFSNAGSNPIIIFRSKHKIFEIFSQDDITPLGVVKGAIFPEGCIQLEEEDIILLCNNGVIKARNKQERLFGVEGLKESFGADDKALSAQELARKVFEQICSFSKDKILEGDLLLVTIKPFKS